MIRYRLQSWLETRKRFLKQLSGFCPGRTTTNSVLHLLANRKYERRHGNITTAVFLDVQHVFYRVSHVDLLQELVETDIGRPVLRWIRGFLCNRESCVFRNLGESSRLKLVNDLPHSSIPSPTLFNIVISPLPRRFPPSIKLSLYTGDICMWISVRNWHDILKRLESAVEVSSIFSNERGMNTEHEIWAYILFACEKCATFMDEAERHVIPTVSSYRFLEVLMDRLLSWSRNAALLQGKTNRFINVMRHLTGRTWG